MSKYSMTFCLISEILLPSNNFDIKQKRDGIFVLSYANRI